MSEHLATSACTPGTRLQRLYRTWSGSGAGLLISGNVMIDLEHAESYRNVILDEEADLSSFAEWARAGTSQGNHFWVQLNHAGRQTPRHVNAAPLAPSVMPPVNVFRKANAFGRAKAMTEARIEDTIARFANAARLAKKAGFTGVQVHGAHGYLASQFLSPLTNDREDQWGGSLENRARFLRTVVREIRSAVGAEFPLGVKLNSADFQRGGFSEDESMAVLRMLEQDSVDLVEVSGGSYEATTMFDGIDGGTADGGVPENGAASNGKSKSTRAREAFFLDYAKKARAQVGVPLMLTGGMRSREVMERAIAAGDIDVVGMARPFAHNPHVAAELLDGTRDRAEDPPPIPGLAGLGGLASSMTSQVQISLISKGKDPRGATRRLVETGLVAGLEVRALRRPRTLEHRGVTGR